MSTLKISLHAVALLLLVLQQNTAPAHCRDDERGVAKPDLTDPGSVARDILGWITGVGSPRNTTAGSPRNTTAGKKHGGSSIIRVGTRLAAGVQFTSIQAAIDSVEKQAAGRVLVKVDPGVYTEQVLIPHDKPHVTLEGAGAEKTVVQWGAETMKLGLARDQRPHLKLPATLVVDAPYFVAKNITFKNAAQASTGSKTHGARGVAARVSGDASVFSGCKFLGSRNTLYDKAGSHFYKDCYVEGSIGVIFGRATSLFEGCTVHGLDGIIGPIPPRGKPLSSDGSGFVDSKLTGSAVLYLGRSLGSFSKVAFINCYLDKVAVPEGWRAPTHAHKDMGVVFGVRNCSGPGTAVFDGDIFRSDELTVDEAKNYISRAFLVGSKEIMT